MGLRLKSLSEDIVDSTTHIWSVVFFLFLAFILLVVPVQRSETELQEPSEFQLPIYEAACWCPAQFEKSQVDYTNKVCSATFNSVVRQTNLPRKKFYEKIVHGAILPFGNVRTSAARNTSSNSSNSTSGTSSSSSKEDQPGRALNLTKLPGTVFLFVLAIVLRLPRILCSILSGCCHGVNVGQTLASAEKGDTMDYNSRQQMYAGLMKAVKDYTRTSTKTSTCLYLLMKVLMIIVLVAEILVVTIYILPRAQETTSTPEVTPEKAKMTEGYAPSSFFLSPGPSSEISNDFNPDILRKHLQNFPIFHCFFRVTQMQNVHEYTVQCLINKRQDTLQKPTQTFYIQLNVFLIVLSTLVILLVFNVLNTFLWLVTLSQGSTRNRLGLGYNTPLDLVFLIQMARANLGIAVSAGLAESMGIGESTSGEGEEVLLHKVL